MLGAQPGPRLAADGWRVRGLDLRPRRSPAGVEQSSPTCATRDGSWRRASPAPTRWCTARRRCRATPRTRSGRSSSAVRGPCSARPPAPGWPGWCTSPRPPCTGCPTWCPTTEEHPRRAGGPVQPRPRPSAEEIAERVPRRRHVRADPAAQDVPRAGPDGAVRHALRMGRGGAQLPRARPGDVRIQMLAVDDLVDAVAPCCDAPDERANDTYNIAARGVRHAPRGLPGGARRRGARQTGRRRVPARPRARRRSACCRRLRLSPVYGRLLHKLLADSYVSIDKARDRCSGSTPSCPTGTRSCARTTGGAATVTPPPPRRGRTSRDPWRQGVLGLAKAFF